jgi:hypothetical protein
MLLATQAFWMCYANIFLDGTTPNPTRIQPHVLTTHSNRDTLEENLAATQDKTCTAPTKPSRLKQAGS